MAAEAISDRAKRAFPSVGQYKLVFAQHWLAYVNMVLGALVLAPFAAPVFMAVGAEPAGRVIYFFYGLLCHQLPERSFFLFGPQVSYSIAEVGRVWPTGDFLTLRQFVGNSAMGWKVAWSDRMVAMYGSIWLGSLLYAIFRQRREELTGKTSLHVLAWLLLGILPFGIDGVTHTINDMMVGLAGTGFRNTNAWLALLTGNLLPATFYAGDAVGSFNNLARLVTGALFGFLTVWFIYPFIDWAMHEWEQGLRVRLSIQDTSPFSSLLSVSGQPRSE